MAPVPSIAPAAETRIGVSNRAPLAADVGDGERTAGQFVGLEAARSGSIGDVGDRARCSSQREVIGVVDNR